MKKFLLLLIVFFPVLSYARDLNISYVKTPFNLQSIIMKNKNILEDELKPLGTSLKWHEINSGAIQAQAMASHSLDVAGVMNSTSIQIAASEGNPLKIVAAVSVPTKQFAIVAAKNGPKNMADLKGKTVAGPKGTVLHQLLAKALKQENLSTDDIKFVQMDIPKAYAALVSGKADAALLAANAVIKAEQHGCKVLTTAEGLVKPKLAIASSEDFIKNNKNLVDAVISAHNKSWEWIKANHDEAIAIAAKELGISISDAELLFSQTGFKQKFNKEDVKSMEEDQKFMLENGMIRNSVNPFDIVLSTAIE